MIGIFITARLGSTRLPKKHLITVEGKTMIEWLVSRYQKKFETEIKKGIIKIFLTTSNVEENKKFKDVLNKYDVEIYYGEDDNIPKRYIDCALENKISYFIVVDGDDILCSTHGSYQLYLDVLKNKNYDILKIIGLPIGLNSIAYKTDYVRSCLEKNIHENLEVGWSRIFNNPKIKLINFGNYDIQNHLRFTLDYEDDSKFFKSIITFFKEKIIDVRDSFLIETVIKNNFNLINSHLSEEYWNNYNKEAKK